MHKCKAFSLVQEYSLSSQRVMVPTLSSIADMANKLDLRRDIRFSTKVVEAVWDEAASIRHIRTDQGQELSCRYYIMASGCLSIPKELDIEGVDRFGGDVYFTSRWPARASTSLVRRLPSSGPDRRESSQYRLSPSRPPP